LSYDSTPIYTEESFTFFPTLGIFPADVHFFDQSQLTNKDEYEKSEELTKRRHYANCCVFVFRASLASPMFANLNSHNTVLRHSKYFAALRLCARLHFNCILASLAPCRDALSPMPPLVLCSVFSELFTAFSVSFFPFASLAPLRDASLPPHEE
jgi:hypothetical protein